MHHRSCSGFIPPGGQVVQNNLHTLSRMWFQGLLGCVRGVGGIGVASNVGWTRPIPLSLPVASPT